VTRAESACRWLLLSATVCVAIIDAAVIAGSARADDPPPLISIGSSDPNSTASAGATIGSDGSADACLNDQHSGADPTQADATPVALNDGTCHATNSDATPPAPNAGARQTTGQQGDRFESTSTATADHRQAVASTSVSAQSANGIQITRIASNSARGTLRLVVTVRDLTRKLIKDAAIAVSPLPGTTPTLATRTATFTNQRGQAAFTLAIPRRYRGQKLRFVVTARTPTAHTSELATAQTTR